MKATFAFIAMMCQTTASAVAQNQAAQGPTQVQMTAENCNPQPDCRINYPSMLPGAFLRGTGMSSGGMSNGMSNGIVNGVGKSFKGF